MQSNADNLHARRLLDKLTAVTSQQLQSVWEELQSWDGTEDVDSRAALIYQVWQRRHLRPWLVDQCLERLGVDAAAAAKARHRLLRDDTLFSDIRPDLRMVEMFDPAVDEDLALLNDGVDQTLGQALGEIEELLGQDRAAWTWGNLHRTTLRHPVLGNSANVPAEWGSLPGIPRAGSGDTVGLSGYDASFNAVMGSSFRLAMDVGEWDQSRVINSPGQSGNPRSPHYSDLFSLWAQDESFPLLYSREAIEKAVGQRIVLRPASQTGGTQ